MTNLEQLDNLVETALLDGKLDISERLELSRRAHELNVTEEVLQQVINERHRAHVQSGAICAKCGKRIENALNTTCLCKASLADQRRSLALEELNRQVLAATSQEQRLLAIKSFPLPTAQNDIVALLSSASSAQTAERDAKHAVVGLSGVLITLGLKNEDPAVEIIKQEAVVWKSKALSILENSRILYSRDDEFLRVLRSFQEKYDAQAIEQKNERQFRLILLGPIILFAVLIANPRICLSIPGIGSVLYPLFSQLQPVLAIALAALLLVVLVGFMRKRRRGLSAELPPLPAQSRIVSESMTPWPQSGRPSSGVPPHVIPPPPVQSISSQVLSRETSPKSRTVAIVLCLLFGYYGFHRFYVGKYGSGVLMMCTAGGFFIWWIIDLFALVTSSFTDSKGRVLV
jgi:hypothetical protein